MKIRSLEATDREALARFLERVPEADRTFFKEDVDDPAVVERFRGAVPADVNVTALELSSPTHIVSAARFARLGRPALAAAPGTAHHHAG